MTDTELPKRSTIESCSGVKLANTVPVIAGAKDLHSKSICFMVEFVSESHTESPSESTTIQSFSINKGTVEKATCATAQSTGTR